MGLLERIYQNLLHVKDFTRVVFGSTLLDGIGHYDWEVVLEESADVAAKGSMTISDTEKVQCWTLFHIRNQNIRVLIHDVRIFYLHTSLRSKCKLFHHIPILHSVGTFNQPFDLAWRFGLLNRERLNLEW